MGGGKKVEQGKNIIYSRYSAATQVSSLQVRNTTQGHTAHTQTLTRDYFGI